MNGSAGRFRVGSNVADKASLAVERQLVAMGSELFEIGLYNPNAGLGESIMIPRVWNAETILKSAPWLPIAGSAAKTSPPSNRFLR